MKAKNVVFGCALTMLLLSAGIAQAETLWSYDFNNLTPGVITVGTDGWTAPAGDWQTLNGYVVDGAGQDGTKAWTIVPSTQADTASRLTIGYRPFSQLTFAQGDTLEQVFQFYMSDTGASNHLTMGAVFGGQTSQWNSKKHALYGIK